MKEKNEEETGLFILWEKQQKQRHRDSWDFGSQWLHFQCSVSGGFVCFLCSSDSLPPAFLDLRQLGWKHRDFGSSTKPHTHTHQKTHTLGQQVLKSAAWERDREMTGFLGWTDGADPSTVFVSSIHHSPGPLLWQEIYTAYIQSRNSHTHTHSHTHHRPPHRPR